MNFRVIFVFVIISIVCSSHLIAGIASSIGSGLGSGIGTGVGFAGTNAIIGHFTKKDNQSDKSNSAPAPAEPAQQSSESTSTAAAALNKCIWKVKQSCIAGGDCDISQCVETYNFSE